MKRKTFSSLLALTVIALIAIPIGAAVFILGFIGGDSPCVLCWEQRIAMMIIALIGLFILRYGPRPRYLGLVVLVSAFGIYMGLRHSAMHAARDIGQGFSIEILGAHTYVWSLVIFWLCLVAAGLALLLVKEADFTGSAQPLTRLGKAAFWLFFAVVAANAFQAVTSTGPPPFLGQGDPVRYSFSPRNWVWSLEEWSPNPLSWRGRWDVEKPSLEALDTNPQHGPLANLPELQIKKQEKLAIAIGGGATDIAFDEASDTFLLVTERGDIVLADGSLKKAIRHTRVDTGYSVDLDHIQAIAFVGSRTLTALSWNKSHVTLRIGERPDATKNFRYFREAADQFDEVSRSRFSTVRARMMYALSLAFDPQDDSFYTATVPNRKYKKMVLSRFDREGMLLREEYSPRLAASSGLALAGEGRRLDEYFITGMAIRNRLLYAISASYSTLLVIDLDKQEIVSAFIVPGLSRPSGVAVKGNELFFINDQNRLFVADDPLAR